VMERESFEDEETARLMNERFICVKLDREERPDVDALYMAAVQALTGQGGWPLNVFLTPELEPFFGGTYFPPDERWGRPSWKRVLLEISELWKGEGERMRAQAGRLAGLLREAEKPVAGEGLPAAACLEAATAAFSQAYDPVHKGFGGAPKFPMPVNLAFLLAEHERSGRPGLLKMVLETLKAMADGGIFDQLGWGLHRYSTDERWRVPHFEKMLYDNAQLAALASDAYLLSQDAEAGLLARRTIEYMLGSLRREDGAFCSSQDADSPRASGVPASEGAYYVWTRSEIEDVLGPQADSFCARYGVLPGGNAGGELAGRNVLYRAQAAPAQEEAGLEEARRALLAARSRRIAPGLDDKVLCSWNGLAISALAKAARAFSRTDWLEAGKETAAFLKRHLYDEAKGTLWRRWREGERSVQGMASDYAFLVQGLLDLYQAGGEAAWLEWALALTETQQRLFAAAEGGLYMTAAGHDKNLLARRLEEGDNVEPSASSVAASNLIRLWRLTGRRPLRQAFEATLQRFGPTLEAHPLAAPAMLSAFSCALACPPEVLVSGEAAEEPARSMLATARRRCGLGWVLQFDAASREGLSRLAPWLGALSLGKAR
ncbi:MAG: thioredoxin domain-containing protein, partial [Elusimicrobia bacterium]|nr:thioredoxin domain-containing protein [Elusimicrobiota bacterium]